MQSFLGESYYVFRGIVLGEEGNMTPLKTTVWEASLNPAEVTSWKLFSLGKF